MENKKLQGETLAVALSETLNEIGREVEVSYNENRQSFEIKEEGRAKLTTTGGVVNDLLKDAQIENGDADTYSLLKKGLTDERRGFLFVGKAIFEEQEKADGDVDQLFNRLERETGIERPSAGTISKRKRIYEAWVLKGGYAFKDISKFEWTKLYHMSVVIDPPFIDSVKRYPKVNKEGLLKDLQKPLEEIVKMDNYAPFFKRENDPPEEKETPILKDPEEKFSTLELPPQVALLRNEAKAAIARILKARGEKAPTDIEFEERAAEMIKILAEQSPEEAYNLWQIASGEDNSIENQKGLPWVHWMSEVRKLAGLNDVDLDSMDGTVLKNAHRQGETPNSFIFGILGGE